MRSHEPYLFQHASGDLRQACSVVLAVSHGKASRQYSYNENAHTNNPCPIKVLWAFSPRCGLTSMLVTVPSNRYSAWHTTVHFSVSADKYWRQPRHQLQLHEYEKVTSVLEACTPF